MDKTQLSETANTKLDRSSYLEDVNTAVSLAGADEHSQIAQSDAAITPGAKNPTAHLIGTSVIPAEIQGEITYLLANAYADGEIEMPELPFVNMEYGGQMSLAFLQTSNSVGGRNQETKAKMINGIGQITRAIGRRIGRRNGYDQGGDDH